LPCIWCDGSFIQRRLIENAFGSAPFDRTPDGWSLILGGGGPSENGLKGGPHFHACDGMSIAGSAAVKTPAIGEFSIGIIEKEIRGALGVVVPGGLLGGVWLWASVSMEGYCPKTSGLAIRSEASRGEEFLQRRVDRVGVLRQPARQMTPIHIARNHQSMGKFSADAVAEGLKSGKFVPTDLAWREPMEAWKPLAEFQDLPEVEDEEENDDLGDVHGESKEAARPEPSGGEEPAWERRKTLGGFSAMIQSAQQILGAPAATFRAMKSEGGFSGPLGYYGILFTLTTWVAAGYQIIALRVNPSAVLGEFSAKISAAEMEQSLGIFMALTPLIAVLGAFLGAAVLHAALLVLGAAKKPFEATFRGWCYAAASASLLQLIPLCGGMMYLMIAVVLLVIAQREIHQVSTVRVAVAVVLPAVVGCGLFLGLYVSLV